MLTTFTDYLHALLPYWWVLVIGGAMALSDLLKWHLPDGKEFKFPHWARVTLSVGAVILAQFFAYRDQANNLSKVIEEKRNSDSMNWHHTAGLNEEKQTNAHLKQKVGDLQSSQSTIEFPNSLRRRTIKTADELYDFLIERQRGQQGRNVPTPANDEERKANLQWGKYQQDTSDLYFKRYPDTVVGIVKEYNAKGVKTGFLEAAADQRPFSAPERGSSWEGSQMDELSQFRDLAYHVDARDNRIQIH